MQKSNKILLDLNNPIFQDDLFSLDKADVQRILSTLRKITKIAWLDIYKDKGLRWELVQSKVGSDGQRLCTIRISQGYRALV